MCVCVWKRAAVSDVHYLNIWISVSLKDLLIKTFNIFFVNKKGKKHSKKSQSIYGDTDTHNKWLRGLSKQAIEDQVWREEAAIHPS